MTHKIVIFCFLVFFNLCVSIDLPMFRLPIEADGRLPWNITVSNQDKTSAKYQRISDQELQITYPAKCVNLDGSIRCGNLVGLQVEMSPRGFPCLAARVSVEVRFPNNFDFKVSGKVFPGLWIGDLSLRRSNVGGGRRVLNAGSMRVMWNAPERPGGQPILYGYLYLPTEISNGSPKPRDQHAVQGPEFNRVVRRAGSNDNAGDTLWQGVNKMYITPGEWTKIEVEIYLNDVGKRNGRIAVRVGDQRRIVDDVMWRSSNKLWIRGWKVASWFGGSDASVYGPDRDQVAKFRNLSYQILK